MDKALIKLFEKEMFNKGNGVDGFRNFVLDYYKKHSKDTFEYPKDRYELLTKGDPKAQWTMEDIVVYYLSNSDQKGKVTFI
ncbi:hypothetical protein LMC05_06155 [Limosilactobacillus reuteri]|uniref:hypothetical protein n=1 Tax=Limosilactobacillus reuteri TaxID=1598 RepID=UPI001E525A87|nr:hypothetical protein [Limosilactobacillus reuteri]MCC4508577.1 hypothetical protein [Limosilactobacillus reuteri]